MRTATERGKEKKYSTYYICVSVIDHNFKSEYSFTFFLYIFVSLIIYTFYNNHIYFLAWHN